MPRTESVRDHYQALRTLANRLVGILHGCLRTHTLYNEHLAWHNDQTNSALQLDGFPSWDVRSATFTAPGEQLWMAAPACGPPVTGHAGGSASEAARAGLRRMR